jgi:hypothetical protein
LKRDLTRFTVVDLLFIAALVALPGWTLVRSWRASGDRPVARVFQDNHLIGVYQLDHDQTIKISDKTRTHMTIEIHNGAVRVAESDCPKGVCKHAGWVRTPGRSIMCVPNRVLIEIKGEAKDYDAESY